MFEIPTTVFGLLTLIILTMAGVIARQYNDNKSLQDKFNAMQDARTVDAKETTDKVTAPLQSISQTINLIYDKLQSSRDNSK